MQGMELPQHFPAPCSLQVAQNRDPKTPPACWALHLQNLPPCHPCGTACTVTLLPPCQLHSAQTQLSPSPGFPGQDTDPTTLSKCPLQPGATICTGVTRHTPGKREKSLSIPELQTCASWQEGELGAGRAREHQKVLGGSTAETSSSHGNCHRHRPPALAGAASVCPW